MTQTPSDTTPGFRFWHGAQRWTGTPELRPSRPQSYHCGPGLYLTTHVDTARKYAKGGGQMVLVEVAPEATVLEDSWLPLADLLQGLASLPRVKGRKAIEQDLRQSAQRFPDGQMPAEFLMNLCVNQDALGGETGPALARWYASKGIDVSLYSRSRGEDWVVVFNPTKIRQARVCRGNEPWEIGDFPMWRAQHAAVSPPEPPPRRPRPR